MKKTKESKALLEVRKWKKEVAKEASKLHGKALVEFYNKSIKIWKGTKAA